MAGGTICWPSSQVGILLQTGTFQTDLRAAASSTTSWSSGRPGILLANRSARPQKTLLGCIMQVIPAQQWQACRVVCGRSHAVLSNPQLLASACRKAAAQPAHSLCCLTRHAVLLTPACLPLRWLLSAPAAQTHL